MVPLLLFLLAFLPRAIYPVSRSMLWYYRAIHFGDAILARDWAGTYQSCHPGVTTMWLSGIGIRLLAWQRGLSSAQLLGDYPAPPGTIEDGVVAGVIPLALVIALCIVLSYFVLQRIAGPKIALVGCCLLALDPFYLTSSKELHVDALVTTFMLVSALFVLDYVYRPRWLSLGLSGVFAGLALLSKSPAFFLVPYTALVVAIGSLVVLDPDSGTAVTERKWGRRLWEFIRALLVWGGVAALVFVALWPATWVELPSVLGWMEDRLTFHVETTHFNLVFFNGQLTYEDPGLMYYLATIVWKTTAVTLPMMGAALLFALLRNRRRASRLTWLLVIYAACFTIQMGLAARKDPRYLLPIFPALDIIAALGLAQSVEAIGRIRQWQKQRWLPTALLGLALAIQAGVTFPHHPYYGTHYNRLLGGLREAQHVLSLQHHGEGLDLAAQYLNSLPRAQQSRAMIHPLGAEIFERSFRGRTVTAPDPWVNYRIYYFNQVTRSLGGAEWESVWNADRQHAPLWSVDFDGVTFVWVYGAPPEEPARGGPERQVDYRLGEHIQLKRVRLSSETVSPGGSLTVVLVWETDAEIEKNYMVFCHLLSAGGELAAQRDGPPLYGVRPTPGWRIGEVIEDSYEIFLGEDLAPGEYTLSVGMYDAESMLRLPAYAAAGERMPQDRIVLGSIHIQSPGG